MTFLNFFVSVIVIALLYSGYRMYIYILAVKNSGQREVFLKINEWFTILTKNNFSYNELNEIEHLINSMFEKKIFKISVLHFTEEFINGFLKQKNFTGSENGSRPEFERIARIDLTKSRQSLKLLTIGLGIKFSQENYSFLNYWNMLKGNHHLYIKKKSDPQGKIYTFEDIEEPFRVLEYYFE